ncbi:MAG: hypothetical protein ABJG68_17180 [Crocinitomicaceae bacterium]
MKHLALLFIGFTLLFTSCSTADAELVADDFHKNMVEGNFDYICENLIDTEAEADLPEEFMDFLNIVATWGPQTNRVKTTDYNKKYSNGVTTVKLGYTFDTPDYHVYEKVVLVKRDEGYKIFMCVMDTDESVVIEGTKDY